MPPARHAPAEASTRWAVTWRYLAFLALANLGWEFAHMPLYTVWQTGSAAEIAFNGLHCTVGDVMIAASSLLAAVLIVGRRDWPVRRRLPVAVAATMVGVIYTAFSEWMNITIRQSWAYTDLMPLLPGTMLGLSPLAQWLILPAMAFAIAYRSMPARLTKV